MTAFGERRSEIGFSGDNVANTDQAEHWNADATRHWVDHDDHHERMLRPFTNHLLEAAAVGTRARVVDIGCGCGHTTLAAARRTAPGDVLGVDLSVPMLTRARQLADDADLDNVRFERADAQTHSFSARAFDAAISRFGAMFFVDPVAAFANIRAALDEGGRFVFVCWQPLAHNPWIAVPTEAVLRHVDRPDPGDPDAPGPFSLAEPDRIRSILGDAGYVDLTVEPVSEALWLGTDVSDAMTFFASTGIARALLDPASPDVTARALDAARVALEPNASEDGVRLASAAWLVAARR